MKKNFKKISAILMCAWNLYMPNNVQDEQDVLIQSSTNTPIVEEMIMEDIEENEEESKKFPIKSILSFIPSIIWTILGFFGSLFKYPLLFIIGILLLLLIGWLLLKNKPWACLLGMGTGTSLIYIDIQDANKIIEEGYLGLFLIIYFIILLIFNLKSKKTSQ